MHRICLAFFLVLTAACGTKTEITTTGEAATGIVTGQGQRLTEGTKSAGLRQRIACEAFRTISFTHSWSHIEDRQENSLAMVDGDNIAPVLLSASKTAVEAVHVERSYYATEALQVYLSHYDLYQRRELKRIKLLKLPRLPQAQVFENLGLGHPKIAAPSPDRFLFAVRDSKGYSVRRTALPLEEVARWDEDFVNPRWERDFHDGHDVLFVDTVREGRISQAILRLNEDLKIVSSEALPAPMLDERAHQIGLRRFNATQVMWLEWWNGKVIFRLMDMASRKTFELSVPDEQSFGPGFALHLLENGARSFVLQTREDLRFYRLERGKLVSVSVLAYPKLVRDRIAQDSRWKPGQIFSEGGEQQLFLVLPEMWGTHLFAIDNAESFRRFGYIRCENPSFLEEK